MSPEEIQTAFASGFLETFEGVDPQTATIQGAFLAVSGLVAVPVCATSSRIDQSNDLEVSDEAGDPIGTLCFTRLHARVERAAMTKWQYAAFLADCLTDECVEAVYTFKSDYLLVDSARFDEYTLRYMASAPIWGGFTHSEPTGAEGVTTLEFVRTIPNLFFPTIHHIEALRRYVLARNPFDRFLRLYHTLELLFDYVVFARIKALGDDLLGFPQLLSEHGRTEQDRLKSILREFCGEPVRLASLFTGSTPFAAEREQIFRRFGKAGDPLPDEIRWEKFVSAIDSGNFDLASLIHSGLTRNQHEYDRLVVDVAAYWIYRIRSSIAHNRVGEYLLQDQHSGFVGDFAEPLLLEVVTQVFANAALVAIA